ASATVTFWCMTTEPGGAPTMRPIWSPTVIGIVHQPSPQARIPRDDAPDLVADGHRHRPPALAPGADPAGRPRARVLGQPPLRFGGHRAERVVDQVRGLPEDREALAVGEELHERTLGAGEE